MVCVCVYMYVGRYACMYICILIAECLSVKRIIMQGKAGTSGFLVRSCACRSVCNEFTIEIYDFMHSLRAFLAHATRGAINITMKDSEDRKQQEANK